MEISNNELYEGTITLIKILEEIEKEKILGIDFNNSIGTLESSKVFYNFENYVNYELPSSHKCKINEMKMDRVLNKFNFYFGRLEFPEISRKLKRDLDEITRLYS